MDEATERSDDQLPWGRDNDRMPGRAASAYVRIPIEAVKAPPPPEEAGPAEAIEEPAPPEVPPTAPEPSAASPEPSSDPEPSSTARRRRRPGREPARRAEDEPQGRESARRPAPVISFAVALTGLVSLLGMFLAGLALVTAAAMVLLPVPIRIAAVVVAAVLLGPLAYPATRWALALTGIHPFRVESLEDLTAVRSATLSALERRAGLRSLASARGGDKDLIRARKALQRYLASHPILRARDGRAWSRLGGPSQARDGLKRRKAELMSPRRLASDEGGRLADWLRSFEEGVLDPLDALARKRVEEHAWRAFKATAASPNAGVDALVTLSSGSSMLDELGRIYNVRMGRVGAATLLARLLVDSELGAPADPSDAPAEEGDEVGEIPAEGGFRAALERQPSLPDAAGIAALLDRGARAYGLRSEPGLHHYFLMRGLGDRAIRLLQPVTRR